MYLGMYHMGNPQMAHLSCVFSKKNYHKNIKKLPSKVANNCLGRAVFSTASRPKTSPNLKFCSIQMIWRVLLEICASNTECELMIQLNSTQKL